MTPWYERQTIGWAIWAVCAAALMAPCIWLAFAITFDSAPMGGRIGFGVVMAAILASFLASGITWAGAKFAGNSGHVDGGEAKAEDGDDDDAAEEDRPRPVPKRAKRNKKKRTRSK